MDEEDKYEQYKYLTQEELVNRINHLSNELALLVLNMSTDDILDFHNLIKEEALIMWNSIESEKNKK